MPTPPPPRIRLTLNGTEYLLRPAGSPDDSPGFPEPPPLFSADPAPAPSAPSRPLHWRGKEHSAPGGFPLSRQFAFSRRTALVSIDVVRAVLGVDAITVSNLVETGELGWVFDLSTTKNSQRELRFWTRELFAPELCRMSTCRALQLILGKSRPRWRGTEIEQLLLASRASVLRWHRAGDLPGETVDHTFWATRESLAAFLKSRLCHPGES